MKKNALIDILINDLKEMQLLLSTFKDHSQIDPSFLDLLRVKHRNVLTEIDLLGQWTTEPTVAPQLSTNAPDEGTTELDEYSAPIEIDIDTGQIVTDDDYHEEPQPEPEPATVEPIVTKTPPTSNTPKPASTADIINFGLPVSDIRKAISISDRAYFIRELFNGDTDKFNSAIDTLNTMNSLDDAQRFVAAYGWPDDDSAAEGFLRAVRRRFIQ